MNIEDAIADVAERMNRLETQRKELLDLSQSVIRGTKRAIHSIHHGTDPSDTIKGLQRDIDNISSFVKDNTELAYLAEDAMMEFAEVSILNAVILNRDIPTFNDLRITPRSWVLGLADCIGEIRRIVLDRLLTDDLEKARSLFEMMQDIYDNIMLFDTPDAILPIRRKQDIARSVMERTRTDLANAVIMRR